VCPEAVIVDLDPPTVLVHPVVVHLAQRQCVRQVRSTTVSPGHDVVGL